MTKYAANDFTVFDLTTDNNNVNNNINNIMLKNKKHNDINTSLSVYTSGAPSQSTIYYYISYLKSKNITDVFCFCELQYDTSIFSRYNINHHYLHFDDGSFPPDEIVNKFNILLDNIIYNKNTNIDVNNFDNNGNFDNNSSNFDNNININIHCQSGMGRAPTMLAYLMVSRYGWNGLDCMDRIRKKIPHAFNKKQLRWVIDGDIKKYKYKHKNRVKKTNNKVNNKVNNTVNNKDKVNNDLCIIL